MKYWKYLKYVIRHKYYVMIECFKMGIYWRGLTHDLSKFLPSEFFPYANYFYGESLEVRENIKPQFDIAWLKHQHRNPHHWQYWILQNDFDGLKFIKMPDKYVKEMLCDWIGAGKAINGKDDVVNWYKDNCNKIMLHGQTRFWIEEMLEKRKQNETTAGI